MIDWCATELAPLIQTLGSIEWHVSSKDKDWIDISSALLTPTIAIFGAVIAGFQCHIAYLKRRDESFDRRYSFYKKIESVYLDLYNPNSDLSHTFDGTDLIPYAEEARWLFGKKVAEHIYNFPEHKAPDQVRHGYVDDWFQEPFRRYLELE